MKKIKEYYRKASQVIRKRKSQRKTDQLKMTDKLPKTKTPPLEYQLFPPQLEWNPFWPPQLPQLPVHKDSVPQDNIFWNEFIYKPSQDGLTKQIPLFKHLELAVGQQLFPTLQYGIVAVY